MQSQRLICIAGTATTNANASVEAPKCGEKRVGILIASITGMPDATAKALNEITNAIIRSAIRVHKTFGSGLLESAYTACLSHDLAVDGLKIERQKRLPLLYRGFRMSCAYRADIVVADLVLVEVKAVEAMSPVFERQLRTYLRLGDYRVGLLLNFGLPTMKDGIERVVNNFPDE